MTRRIAIAFLLAAACGSHAAELPRVFADGMVLQRDRPIPVWGRSTPGARVRVAFAGHRLLATADANGTWRVALPAQPAGGPFELRVEDAAGTLVLHDVLVGEVWLASGQSNMEWPLSQSDDAAAAIASANDPWIRHFKIPKSWSGTPQWQLQGGSWVAASPDTAGAFSAVAYHFARELRRATGVPVGIIDSSWGGSSIEAWTDAPTQGLDVAASAAVAERLAREDAEALAGTRAHLQRWGSLPADDAGWQSPASSTSDWVELKVPGLWETAGYVGMDGVAWYRRSITLDAAEARAGIVLGVGRIDDSDTTWVNGVQVGQTLMQYNQPRAYAVPASALRAGENTIAVRVVDTGGGGGIHGDADEVFVQPVGGTRRPLEGAWRFRVARAELNIDGDKNQRPALLYNAMIHPLQPYALRGVIWYQGESNAFAVPNARAYRTQFPAMIRQWRSQFEQPAMPFLWVQLASFGSGSDAPGISPWSVLRESQSATLALPGTAQVVAIDIGDPLDIHPRNKREVGRRLSLAARHQVFGEPIAYRGPTPLDIAFEGRQARVAFESGAARLAVRGGGDSVHGFELAGPDRQFHPAQARLDGGSVVVRSDAVATPVALRYGWRDDAGSADLANDAGLPASPFRSDDW